MHIVVAFLSSSDPSVKTSSSSELTTQTPSTSVLRFVVRFQEIKHNLAEETELVSHDGLEGDGTVDSLALCLFEKEQCTLIGIQINVSQKYFI